jgi:hypothetical protein
MILSILLVKPKNDKENSNDDKVTLSAMKMKWNNKQKKIARASTWSTNLIMKKDCKANKDDCNGGLDCENKRVQSRYPCHLLFVLFLFFSSTKMHVKKKRNKTNKRWQG